MDYLYEVPGSYGSIGMRERLLQRIWEEQKGLVGDLRLVTGEDVSIENPGSWNPFEGPDFKDADITIAGERKFGDIEIHFYERDWFLHGHDRDGRYDRVILHVVLFDPMPEERSAECISGRKPGTLILAPHLPMDLESLIALEEYCLNPRDVESIQWEHSGTEEIQTRLRTYAKERWRIKTGLAAIKLAGKNWQELLHQGMLETLGAVRNRAATLRVAERIPYSVMAGKTENDLMEAGAPWRFNGLRPASAPARLLCSYLKLCRTYPDWPEALKVSHDSLTHDWARTWHQRVRPMGFTPARWNTFVIDHLIPFINAYREQEVGGKSEAGLFDIWFSWPAGTVPEKHIQWLRNNLPKTVTPGRGSNGWHQGLLHSTLSQKPFR